MPCIRTLTCRKILNSHVEFTNEFVVEMADGSFGIGSSPQGETVSIYEDRIVSVAPEDIVSRVNGDGYIGRSLDQEEFDGYLQRQIPVFGRNNTYGLSLAFFDATRKSQSLFDIFNIPVSRLTPPRLVFNILNGGQHAYTNPVLSDFTEYLLVSKSSDLGEVVGCHKAIQQSVKEKLLGQRKQVVSGNVVNCFATADNRECIDFLMGVRDQLGLGKVFDLMIDASAGDLWTDAGYRLSITDNVTRPGEEFCEYWMGLIRQYDIRFLEDPFREADLASWQRLTTSQHECSVIGDNLYSSDAERIRRGASERCSHGTIIKPNQAGTISAVRRATEVAQSCGQIVCTSHRSISTEETFISLLTCAYGVHYIKIGPLLTDYSSVMRLNEIIRLTGSAG